MSSPLADLALAALFVHPIELPYSLRLWMFFPLALMIATVYRATRAHSPRELLVPTIVTFLQIVAGMFAIAIGFWLVHQLVLQWH